MAITVISVAVSMISSILAAAQSSSLGYSPDCFPQYLDVQNDDESDYDADFF